MEWFVFTRRRLPGPGAMAYALVNRRLPRSSVYGRAFPHPDQKNVLQPPPMVAQSQGVLVAGVGGVEPGQMYYQPLIDPETGADYSDASGVT